MFFCRQLHVLLLLIVSAAAVLSSLCIDAVSMRLLWLSIDYLFRVVHAALTDFDVVSVENFPELVVFGKVFVYWGEESVSDVGTGVFTKSRVVPEDVVALSVFPFACFGWFVMYSVVVSTFVECFLV